VTCTLLPEGLEPAERLDGYYVLETTRSPADADASTLLTKWKGQWQIEHRHRDGKGPLRIRPLFVTSNRRIEALVTILGIALIVFSLSERAARRDPPATTCSKRSVPSPWRARAWMGNGTGRWQT